MIMNDTGSLYTNSKIEKAFEEKNKNNFMTHKANKIHKFAETLFMPKTCYEGQIGKTGLMRPLRFSNLSSKPVNSVDNILKKISSSPVSYYL